MVLRIERDQFGRVGHGGSHPGEERSRIWPCRNGPANARIAQDRSRASRFQKNDRASSRIRFLRGEGLISRSFTWRERESVVFIESSLPKREVWSSLKKGGRDGLGSCSGRGHARVSERFRSQPAYAGALRSRNVGTPVPDIQTNGTGSFGLLRGNAQCQDCWYFSAVGQRARVSQRSLVRDPRTGDILFLRVPPVFSREGTCRVGLLPGEKAGSEKSRTFYVRDCRRVHSRHQLWRRRRN